MNEYCSDNSPVEQWDNHMWHNELCVSDVLVMTPQILLNMLRFRFITMAEIALIVFDECHHAKKGHPYNCIMKVFHMIIN